MKRQHEPVKEGDEQPRCTLSSRTWEPGTSGGRHDGPIVPLLSKLFLLGQPSNTSTTPLQLVTLPLSDDDEDEASSGSCTPSPSDSPLLYEPSNIGSANSKRMRPWHKVEHERGAVTAVKECKLWDKLPLTLKQEDIAWFVGTSLCEDDCAPLHEGEGAF